MGRGRLAKQITIFDIILWFEQSPNLQMTKRQLIRRLGADKRKTGKSYPDRYLKAQRWMHASGWFTDSWDGKPYSPKVFTYHPEIRKAEGIL